jgi:Patatin-like phospholipase
VGKSGIGICCSGGGIRSAAFNLGALQALDEADVLRRADYLSAVSGGSFIASAYAVASRYSTKEALEGKRPFAPGSPEEGWVRNHCSYLTNSVTDTVRLAAVAATGLLANLVFFTALLWTVARPLGWFYSWWQPSLRVPGDCTAGLSPDAAWAAGCYAPVDLTGLGPWALTAGGIALGGVVLALGVRMFQPGWPLRQTLRRVAALLVAAGALVALVTLVLPELIVFTRNVLGGTPDTGPVSESTGVGSSSDKGGANLGFVATVGGSVTLLALVLQIGGTLRRAAVTGGRAFAAATSWTKRFSGGLRRMANTILGALVGPVALAAGALLILNGGAQAERPSSGELLLWGVMALLTIVMLWFADVTAWSLHPLYKWRLARTFAVHRIVDGNGRRKAEPVPYKKLLHLSELTPEQFPGHRPGSPAFPELLVCASVNLSDQGTTPPGQASLSFVFGPREIGSPNTVVVPQPTSWWRRLLYPAQTEEASETLGPLQMPTREYEAAVGERRKRDITISAAVAMSGAAVAPSMGKMTRAPLRFLLALTNVRLGVWLPNPIRPPTRAVPANPRQVRLLYEVAGRHRVRSTFLYVTDGGHIENLGLLELLRRECTTIVCLDAAGGSTETFSTLGQAIALAAAELNVHISIDPARDLEPLGDRTNRADHTVGKIRYPKGADGKVKEGQLIYAKALVTAESPWDVRAYATKDRRFPATPTSDQLFSGETFDAYQALGRHVGERCADVVTGEAGAGAGAGAPSGVTDIRENVSATAVERR